MAPSGGLHNDRDNLFPFIEHAWNSLHDVTEEASFNLKEAMKMLQELDSSDVFGQNQETRRRVCGKKAMSRVDRALRQLASHDSHMEELKLRMHVMREKLEIAQGSQTEMMQRMDAVASEMQEALRRLHEEEVEKRSMAGVLEGAKLAADMAQRSVSDTLQQLRLKEIERKKLLGDIACLKNQNEKMQRINEQRINYEATEKSNLALSAQVKRYKEVVARVTADNMVFLMKLRHNEDALQVSKGRQQQLEREMENSRGRWMAEASAEIEGVVKGTLSKAEVCESQLQRLLQQDGELVREWQAKLQHAHQRLAHVTAARDWLEEALVPTRHRIKVLEDEILHLQGRLDAETKQRLHAEGDTRALVLTLRETTEQVTAVKGQYSGALKEIEAAGNDLRTKEHEVEELLAALETANLQLETQQNVNTAIMRKKEEIEWQLLEAEAQRHQL